MRTVPNDIVQGLIRYLPRILGRVEMRGIDNKTYNAVRLTKKILKRLETIERTAGTEKTQNEGDERT